LFEVSFLRAIKSKIQFKIQTFVVKDLLCTDYGWFPQYKIESHVIFNSLAWYDGFNMVFKPAEDSVESELVHFNSKNQKWLANLFNNYLQSTKSSICISKLRLSFSIVKLEENLKEFMTIFQYKKCDKCCQYCQKGSLAVCLICGVTLCKSLCKSLYKPEQTKIGNLNNHSSTYHSGSCAFVGTSPPIIFVVHFPKNIILNKSLYIDKYGQEFDLRSSNWEDFKLHYENYDFVRKILLTNRVAQEVWYEIQRTGQKIKDGYL